MKVLVRSFVCCVLATAAWAQVVVVYPPAAQPSTVVMVERESPAPVRAAGQNAYYGPVRQITYLIALKNSEVQIADQYWVKGETLYYLTADHQERTVPVNNIDLTTTMRLNSERNVAFNLPAYQEKVVAQSRVIRHTVNVAHKRCYCTTTPQSAHAPSPATGAASRATRKGE